MVNIENMKSEDISVPQAQKYLGGVLARELEKKEVEKVTLDIIIQQLKKLDEKIADIGDDRKNDILMAIKKYKEICNCNDAENRTAITLGIFTDDLYKDSLHFFLELIQNADDASKGGKNHNLSITITKDYEIVFEYDERGFNFSDIFSITSLGNSTKKAKLDKDADIGEKGIGFKSIFAVAKEIKIQSKYFGFSIINDENNPISILEPKEIKMSNYKNTKLTLSLKDEYTTEHFFEEIDQWLQNNVTCHDMANPFLFLKNITDITYTNLRKDTTGNGNQVKIEKSPIKDSAFTLITIGNQRYIKYSEPMKFTKDAIASRWKYLENDLIDEPYDYTISRNAEICFPLEVSGNEEKGKFYSYLPTNIEINFPVFINLDVHLTASRGNIQASDFAAGSKWNEQVKNNLPTFLENAYMAVVGTATKELTEVVGDFKKLREELYNYLPHEAAEAKTGDVNEIYNNELKDFFGRIIKAPIFLANDGKFRSASEIAVISSGVTKISKDQERTLAIYNFIGETAILLGKKRYIDEFNGGMLKEKSNNIFYPRSLEWNRFLIETTKNTHYFLNVYDVILAKSGIKKHWKENNKSNEAKQTIETLLRILLEYKDLKLEENIKSISMIPVESGDAQFVIKSYEEITRDKALFFHADEKTKEDTQNSVYVFQDTQNKFPFENIYEFIKTTYDIRKYNLANYFDKEINDIKDRLDDENMKDFIQKTFPFYKQDKLCFEKSQCRQQIQEYIIKYTLSTLEWEDYCGGNKVSRDYVRCIGELDNDILSKWTIPVGITEKDQFIDYLIFLGIKHKIDFVSGTDDIDEISKSVMVKTDIKINKETRELECDPLQEYYLSEINSNIKKISRENLIRICIELSVLTSVENDVFYKKNRVIFGLKKDEIGSINKEIVALLKEEKECYSLSDSSFCIIEQNTYEEIWNEIEIKDLRTHGNQEDKLAVEIEFMQSFFQYGSNFLKDLRILKIINVLLKNNYRWIKTLTNMTLDGFLLCHPALKDEELSPLMEEGYIVDLQKEIDAKTYFAEYKDLSNFLQAIEIKDSIKQDEFIITENNNMTENHIKFDENHKNKEIKFLIKDHEDKKSEVMFRILEALQVKMNLVQKKEIQDYFDEKREIVTRLEELYGGGKVKYCDGVFLDYHDENIEKAKRSLDKTSVWDKAILQRFCEPFILSGNEKMEGYGYVCPICGHKSNAVLNGMKFERFKNGDGEGQYPYLYIVSCLNCNKMLSVAKNTQIKEFPEAMRDFQNCYMADDGHIKNHSSMKTAILDVETREGKTVSLPMKISYLNMVLYEKLARV